MLKTLMLKQCIAIFYYKFKCILSLIGRNDTKQARSLILIVVPQADQVPEVFLNYVWKCKCYHNLFADSGSLFHFEESKKEVSFDMELFWKMGALIYSNCFFGLYFFLPSCPHLLQRKN